MVSKEYGIIIVKLNRNGAANPPLVLIREKLTLGLKSTSFQVSVSALRRPSSLRRSQAGPSSTPSIVVNLSSPMGGGTSDEKGGIVVSDPGGASGVGICKPANSASGFQLTIPSCQPRSVGTYRP